MEKGITLSLVHQPGEPGLEKPLEVRVYVERVATCPHCGSGGLHRHGVMPRRRALHAFVAGRWVFLSWTPSRLRCPARGRTVTCRPKGVRRWARLTDGAVFSSSQLAKVLALRRGIDVEMASLAAALHLAWLRGVLGRHLGGEKDWGGFVICSTHATREDEKGPYSLVPCMKELVTEESFSRITVRD